MLFSNYCNACLSLQAVNQKVHLTLLNIKIADTRNKKRHAEVHQAELLVGSILQVLLPVITAHLKILSRFQLYNAYEY